LDVRFFPIFSSENRARALVRGDEPIASQARARSMSCKLARVLALAAVGVVWLAGCEGFKTYELLGPKAADTAAAPAADALTTGSIAPPGEAPAKETAPGLLGSEQGDDLSLGKKHFRAADYGLAEKYFRHAVETHPNDAEAWLDLAAAYDRLRRFDLADRAYAEAIRIVGPTAQILNNQGFSYLLRADYARAREKLLAARAANPHDPHAKANLRLLDESFRKGKAVE
jgi:Flp pilus assembly protein TadD